MSTSTNRASKAPQSSPCFLPEKLPTASMTWTVLTSRSASGRLGVVPFCTFDKSTAARSYLAIGNGHFSVVLVTKKEEMRAGPSPIPPQLPLRPSMILVAIMVSNTPTIW